MLNNKSIGEQVKELRELYGFSQKQVAKKLDIPRPSVSQVEQGKRDLTAVELLKLNKVFNNRLWSQVQSIMGETVDGYKTRKSKVIYFMRHGEAMDDLYDQYGGWADPELSSRGVNRAYSIAQTLKDEGVSVDMIYSSPLKRATHTAEILSRELVVKYETLQYLKERNTYGLLCGMNKELAKRNYPELVNEYENGKYVLGSERYADFVDRLSYLFEFLTDSPYNNIICVTHGKLIQAIINEFLKMNYSEVGDAAVLVIGMDKKGLYYIESDRIQFSR